jgi:hypothetical protein
MEEELIYHEISRRNSIGGAMGENRKGKGKFVSVLN